MFYTQTNQLLVVTLQEKNHQNKLKTLSVQGKKGFIHIYFVNRKVKCLM